MLVQGTDYYVHENGLASTHITIDLYKSGIAWVNKARAMEQKESYPERKLTFVFNQEHADGVLAVLNDKGERTIDILELITPPFRINIIEKGE